MSFRVIQYLQKTVIPYNSSIHLIQVLLELIFQLQEVGATLEEVTNSEYTIMELRVIM